MTPTRGPILAADDDETDRFILNHAFEKANLPGSIVIVEDGKEVVDYLIGQGKFGDHDRHSLPSLLLLDLKMPRMDGLQVLAWLATQPGLNEIPVIVLSSSSHEIDIQKARQLGAHDYFIKPHTVSEWVKMLQDLQKRFLS